MIPLFRPSCGDEEIEAVTRVMRSGWWAMGPETEAFEEEFAAYTGSRFAVAVNSGTMALELAARAIGLTDGIVVTTPLTFISTALAMHHAGNQVVFADIDENTLCLDWDSARHTLWARGYDGPKGVVPVWFGGRFSSPGGLPAGTRIIEDCAHAAGTFQAGRIGEAACWSFQAVKNLATGDGGMVTTDYKDVADEIRRMRWVGIDKSTWDRDKDARIGYGWDYDIRSLDGEKAHMNDIAAAIGRVQLRKLDQHNYMRRTLAHVYNEEFAGLEWLRRPYVSPVARTSSNHLYVVRVPADSRARFIQHMIARGVSAGVHYKPLTEYRNSRGRPLFDPALRVQGRLPVTERVWKTLVTLPLFPDMTLGEHEQVIAAVKSFPAS